MIDCRCFVRSVRDGLMILRGFSRRNVQKNRHNRNSNVLFNDVLTRSTELSNVLVVIGCINTLFFYQYVLQGNVNL